VASKLEILLIHDALSISAIYFEPRPFIMIDKVR